MLLITIIFLKLSLWSSVSIQLSAISGGFPNFKCIQWEFPKVLFMFVVSTSSSPILYLFNLLRLSSLLFYWNGTCLGKHYGQIFVDIIQTPSHSVWEVICAKSLQSCLTLLPSGLQATRLLCPWGCPGKTTGVGCHDFLQGIFPTQGLNPSLSHLLHWHTGFVYHLRHLGSQEWSWLLIIPICSAEFRLLLGSFCPTYFSFLVSSEHLPLTSQWHMLLLFTC